MEESRKHVDLSSGIDGAPTVRSARGRSLGENLVLIVLSTVIVLLLLNIYAIYAARNYSDSCCRKALEMAAEAARKGKSAQAIKTAALEGLASIGQVGFTDPPEFTEFHDDVVMGLRQLRVQTHTYAHIPVPLLVMDEPYRSGTPLSITSTYVAQFKGQVP